MRLSLNEQKRLVELLDALIAKGIEYRYGAEAISDNPFSLNKKLSDIKYLDCSELVEWVYWNAFRLKLPDGSFNQYKVSLPISGNYEAGDLVFRANKSDKKISHIGIYIGDNKVVESTPPKVIKRLLDQFAAEGPERKTYYAGIRRISLDLIARI